MRVGIMTKEWPPQVYGGAGVHVVNLVENLRPLADVVVQCFGPQRPDALSYQVPAELLGANPVLETLGIDLAMVQGSGEVDVVHSHTWYANFAGHVASLLYNIPHVMTAHSLEPLRPWKAEQLGGGYRVSSWVEATSYDNADAIIAVSEGMRADVLTQYNRVDPDRVHVVYNGINTDEYRPDTSTDLIDPLGVPTNRPYVAFLGRITRQKGIQHLLAATEFFNDDVVLVLCASSPDTPEMGVEVAAAVAELRARRGTESVVWIEQQLSRPAVRQLLTNAVTFICPSIYEPQGIVNLEAMACETAVVASAVGGIPEVVVDGETGILVEYQEDNERQFQRSLAAAVNSLVADPARATGMGIAGRARAEADFSWSAIAEQTVKVYQSVLKS